MPIWVSNSTRLGDAEARTSLDETVVDKGWLSVCKMRCKVEP